VALGAALLLFILPCDWKPGPPETWGRFGSGARLLGNDAVRRINWDVPLLMGGGFALGAGIEATGLHSTIGDALATALGELPPPVVPLVLILFTSSFTQVLSDSATATVMLPIYAEVAATLGMPSLSLMLPATVACSLAFMLPTSTPPNAIAYGTGLVSIRTMVTTGCALNCIGAFFAWGVTAAFGPPVFGY